MGNPSHAILRRLSGFCGKLKRAAELGWRDSDNPSEHLCEMAWAGVANFEAHIDKAARGFTNQLLGARDSLSRDELQRSHAGPGHWSATLSATTCPVRYRGKAAAVLRSGVFAFTEVENI